MRSSKFALGAVAGAALAQAHHVTAQQLKAAMVAAGQVDLDGRVRAGTLTQARADALRDLLVAPIAEKLSRAIELGSQATPTS